MSRRPRLLRAIESVVAAAGRAAGWLVLPMMALIIFDVAGRRFFRTGSVTLQELEWHLHAVIFLFVAAYAYQRGIHVRIDILRDRMSPRLQDWVEIAGCALLLIPFAGVLAYFGYAFWEYAWRIGEDSAAPGGLPYRWAIKAAVPVGAALLVLQGVATLWDRLLARRRAHREARRS